MSRSRSMWSSNGLYVDASVGEDGSLHISGQDLRTFDDEYEYELTVAPDDVPRVIAGLGGEPGGDVVDLLVSRAGNWLRKSGDPSARPEGGGGRLYLPSCRRRQRSGRAFGRRNCVMNFRRGTLVGHAEDIVNVGELTWLRSLGVEPEFWSRLG